MSELHEKFLVAIKDERTRLVSRRNLFGNGAKVAGGAALAMGAMGLPISRSLQSTVAQDFTDDLDILNYALTLEHLEYAFYRDGLEEFDEDAFTQLVEEADDEDDADETDDDDEDDEEDDVDLPGDDPLIVAEESGVQIRLRLEEIRDHEEAHVMALTETITALGGTPVEEAEYDFGYDDLADFLEVAAALENTGVAAYAGAAPFITDRAIVVAALGIHSVEARHAAYLNLRIGDSPFPDAVDQPLTREEVLAIAGPFIVSTGDDETPTAEADDTGTGGDDDGGTGDDDTDDGGDDSGGDDGGDESPTPDDDGDEDDDVDATVEATVDPEVTVEATVEATVDPEVTVEATVDA